MALSAPRLLLVVLVLGASTRALVLGQSGNPPAVGRVLRVTSAADDGSEGTLRWAIAASNVTPERERIEVELQANGPRAIVLTRALPAIKGPVQIEGTAWARSGEYVAIDGSGYIAAGGPESCPGAAAGQYGANVRTTSLPGLQLIDTDDIEIAGVEIRRFCIGVLINRSTRVLLRDSRIVGNRGGAGVMLTGDDGQGNPTSTTTVHNTVLRNEFIDNGDGLELTRGAAFNLVADNVFRSTAATPEPAQGIEILRGNDNVVSGNRFEGYSDGLQINWGDRNYIASNTFTGNTFGLNLTGIANVVDRNVITGNRVGIAVRPADPSPVVRLTRNRISRNGLDIRRCEAGGSCDPMAPKGAMAFGVPGLEHASFVGSRGRGVTPAASTLLHVCVGTADLVRSGDAEEAPRCQPAPNQGLRPPTLTSTRAEDSRIIVSGTVAGAGVTRYVVELFGNSDEKSDEAEFFLDDVAVSTDTNGHAVFTARLERSAADVKVRSVTATVTSAAGATSPLSRARAIVDSSPRSRKPPAR